MPGKRGCSASATATSRGILHIERQRTKAASPQNRTVAGKMRGGANMHDARSVRATPPRQQRQTRSVHAMPQTKNSGDSIGQRLLSGSFSVNRST